MPDEPAPQGSQSQHRSQRMKLAVMTSLVSKVSTALVALIAIPIAKKALGDDLFTLYGVLTTCLLWARIFTSGVGPALTIQIAAAAVHNDLKKASRLAASALLPIGGVCILLLLGALAYAQFGSIEALVGQKISYDEGSARVGIALLGVLISLQLWLGGFESIQAGYQETHFANVRQIGSNVVSLAAILFVASKAPSVNNLILAQFVPFILAQVMNTIKLLRDRPHLLPRFLHFDRVDFKTLGADAIAYMLSGGLASYLTLQFPVIFVAHQVSPAESALVVMSLSLVTQLFGMISMIIVPLRPALADAQTRGEFGWIRRAYRKALMFTVAYGAAVGLGILGLGGFIFHRILHASYTPDLVFCGLWAVNFALYCWENLHFNVLFGTNYRYAAAGLWLGRSLVAYAVMTPLIGKLGPAGVYAALAATIVGISAVPYFVLIKRALHPAPASTG